MDDQELIRIIEHPTVVDNNHESLYRCYHILGYVMKMVERGDSIETIIEVVELLKSFD